MSPLDVRQSVLSPAGMQAASIHSLWLLMLWVCAAVFIAVMIALVLATVRGRRRRTDEGATATSEQAMVRTVGGAIGLTAITLIGLLVASIWTGRKVTARYASDAVTIAVTGHQWWWEIQYEDPITIRRAVTANEMHIPVGRPVVLQVTSRDVIHSFWAPNLQGKRDLIPGYTTALPLFVERPGVFRGQCAEFCGMQHAHMALDVTAEPDGDFNAWLDAIRQPAQPPADDIARRGHDVFMQSRCAGCHTIRGTDAAGQVAPDLTHVASRGTLGAGTLPNTSENLAAWIRDPQSVKRGNQMPPTPLSTEDLRSLVAYLETLR